VGFLTLIPLLQNPSKNNNNNKTTAAFCWHREGRRSALVRLDNNSIVVSWTLNLKTVSSLSFFLF